MNLKLLNVVLLADNYQKLVDWYINTLGLELQDEWTEDYHYAELSYNKQLIVGITPATEMKHKLTHPRNNAAIIQLVVSDIQVFYERIKQHDGVVLFGVNYDQKEQFYFGAVADIEGNEIWVIQTKDK